ncbi:MAG: 30S ribosomal protein S12 methylthiotransferase RimO [bacterium]
MMKVGIITLGCDKNTVDSEYLAGTLARTGVMVANAEPEPCGETFDAVFINTCGFIADAKAESVRAIIAWLEHKFELAAQGCRMKVFVMGCLSQRYVRDLSHDLPEVDGFMGVGDVESAISLLNSPVSLLMPVSKVFEPPRAVAIDRKMPRLALGSGKSHGFLKIADGCSHKCAFCAIPSFKGKYQSVPNDVLLSEARMLVKRGVKEIVLVAQDTSAYGRDIYGSQYGIAELLAELADLSGDFWLRIMYFYPGGVTDKFIEAMTSSPRIIRYLDIPLQHLHPDVLRRMNRSHLEIGTFDLVRRLRKVLPGIVLRTTFMVGYPGETKEEFEFLCAGARELSFEHMGAFRFSAEQDTPAAAIKPRVLHNEKMKRFRRLMRQQADISLAWNRTRIGTTQRVLVEGQLDDGRHVGRCASEAPEVDGYVIISNHMTLKPHSFADVRITDAETYDLFGEV